MMSFYRIMQKKTFLKYGKHSDKYKIWVFMSYLIFLSVYSYTNDYDVSKVNPKKMMPTTIYGPTFQPI